MRVIALLARPRVDQLIELGLNGLRIPVLRALNEES
jgi:hypothetical protein